MYNFQDHFSFLLVSFSSDRLSLHAREVSRPRCPVLVWILSRHVPRVPLLFCDAVGTQDGLKRRNSLTVGVLKLCAVCDDSRLDRDRSLIRSPDVATLNGSRVLISRHTDADGNIGAKAKAFLANLGVPFEQIGCGEVVETSYNCATVLPRVDDIRGDTCQSISLLCRRTRIGTYILQLVGRVMQTHPALTLQYSVHSDGISA